MKVLFTIGAGCIGSGLVRHIIDNTALSVINLDFSTYAVNNESLASCGSIARYSFELADNSANKVVRDFFKLHYPDIVMYLMVTLMCHTKRMAKLILRVFMEN